MQTMNFVAGLTIEQALIRARNLAMTSNQPVLADINDIKMTVDKNTDIKKALAEYHEKLAKKHAEQTLKIQRCK